MVVLKTYKVDLDYEASLFDPAYQEESAANQKIIKEFEYVFFLIEKEKYILKNYKNYDEKYLDSLRALGFIIPDFNPTATQYEYWWGHHHQRDLEQKLNSKLTSAEVAQINKWGFVEGALVESVEQLLAQMAKYPEREKWIIKHPHGFSGIGHRQFSADAFEESFFSKYSGEKVLLEPVYERVFDIGTTFEVTNGIIKRQFMVENFNSEAGNFKGGAGSSSVDKFKKYISEKYDYSLDELEKTTRKIAETYLKMGALSNIQIDSFIYREQGELKLYALVEVNYRKTMGLVIQSLAEKYPDSKFVEWKIESVKNLKKNPLSDDWIKISPDGNHFHSFFRIQRYL